MFKWLFGTTIFLSIFFLNFLPIKDPDFGWHYRCGYELLQGQPCLANTFSYFLSDYKSYYPGFVYDALTAIVFNSFGFLGLSIVHALIMTGALYFFHKLAKQNMIVSAISFSIVIYLAGGTLGLGLRPQIITFFFILLGYYLLISTDSKKISEYITQFNKHQRKLFFSLKYLPFIFLYPLLILLWVNTHIGFFTGLVLYGFYWLNNFILWTRKKIANKIFFLITIIGGFSCIATLINPFSYKVYIELYRHLISPLNTMIAEWVAPPPLFILIILISLIIIPILQVARQKLSIFEVSVLIFFGITAIMARRNIPLYLIFATIYLLHFISKKNISNIYPLLFPFIGAFLIFISFINIKNTVLFHSNWNLYCTKGASNYPCHAIQEYPQLSGNIYAAYEWGGFLIWKRPDIKIFVDGRMPAWKDEYGESPYSVYLKILQTQSGWNEKLRKYKTDYLLLAQGTFLDLLLDKDAEKYGWKKVYEDKTHAIFQNINY